MAYYTPILSSMLQSSILLEDVETRWLWTVMLILGDESRDTQGVVDCPIERLAQIANLSPEKTRAALTRLCSPDLASRSKKLSGARLLVLDRQEGFEDRKWKIVNWNLYKKKVRQIQVNAAVRRHREREALKSDVIRGNQEQSKRNPQALSLSPSLTPTQDKPKTETGGRFAPPTLAEIEAFIEAKKITNVDPLKFFSHYESIGWKVGKNPMKKWKMAVWKWSRND